MRQNRKNSFTEALGEELNVRKTFSKAKTTAPEEEIFLSEVKADTEFVEEIIEMPKPKPQPIKKVKKSKPKKKKVAEVPPQEKISQPPKPEIDSEFEKRIFAEAENDFFEEKTPQNIGKNIRSNFSEQAEKRPNFYNKVLKEKFEELEDDDKTEDELSHEYDPELYRKLTRVELSGVALSGLAIFYSLMNMDKPLFFLSFSLFVHLIRPLVGGMCGKYNRAVQNGLRSFSFVLFAGSIIFLFMIS